MGAERSDLHLQRRNLLNQLFAVVENICLTKFMPKIRIVEGKIYPKCPYCGDELDSIETLSDSIDNRLIYLCPNCKKLLEIEQSSPK